MRTLAAAVAALLLAGCWPAVPDDLDPAEGVAIVRVRAAEGDTYLKLKDGLAQTLYRALDGDEVCAEVSTVDDGHCRRQAGQVLCSTENLRDPYVCELHLVAGDWVDPREDFELYHSLEANRRYGTATVDDPDAPGGTSLTIAGDAGEALAEQLGVDAPVVLFVDLQLGRVIGP